MKLVSNNSNACMTRYQATNLMKVGNSLRPPRFLPKRKKVSSMSELLGAPRKQCCHCCVTKARILWCSLRAEWDSSPFSVSLLNKLTKTLVTNAATTHFRMNGRTKQYMSCRQRRRSALPWLLLQTPAACNTAAQAIQSMPAGSHNQS